MEQRKPLLSPGRIKTNFIYHKSLSTHYPGNCIKFLDKLFTTFIQVNISKATIYGPPNRLGSGHLQYHVPGRKETARGMKTAAVRIPGYEIHRTSKTGKRKLIQYFIQKAKGSKNCQAIF